MFGGTLKPAYMNVGAFFASSTGSLHESKDRTKKSALLRVATSKITGTNGNRSSFISSEATNASGGLEKFPNWVHYTEPWTPRLNFIMDKCGAGYGHFRPTKIHESVTSPGIPAKRKSRNESDSLKPRLKYPRTAKL